MRGVIACGAILAALMRPGIPHHGPSERAGDCRRANLPAYAHNDYQNARPLAEAVELGYRGVEADVFLVNGQLRVGHDRRRAARGGTFEALYLAPLAELAKRCGRLTDSADAPFLLLVEIKDESRPTYDSTVALLARYERWIAHDATQRGRPIEAVMVGWHPPKHSRSGGDPSVMRQQRIASYGDTIMKDAAGEVRLLSLDYGKTIGRRWTTAVGRRRWLETIRAARRASAGRLLRAHNVPVDARVYDELLAAGVDLLGTTELARTRVTLSRTATTR